MFKRTDTTWAPWTVVKSNDKKRARIGAMRYVLSLFDYPNRDPDIVGTPDPLIVGPASEVYEHGETPGGPGNVNGPRNRRREPAGPAPRGTAGPHQARRRRLGLRLRAIEVAGVDAPEA